MFYPTIEENQNSRSLIDTWLGYNHNRRIGLGEFYDMENLSSDLYPLMSPRKIRPVLVEDEEEVIRGILFTDNNLCYVKGDTLYYAQKSLDLTTILPEEKQGKTDLQTLLRFGSYVLIYPMKVYVNVYDFEDSGLMEDTVKAPAGVTITYSICDMDGNDYENVHTGEEAPASGYWLREGLGLYLYNESTKSWEAVPTVYIRITMPGADLSALKEGDTVTMNTTLENVNEGSIIQKIQGDSFVVIGIMDVVTKSEQTSEAWTLTVQRKLPELDYVCTSGNRVWGCHYGYLEDGSIVNEIYASKLGDFKNWYTFKGVSTDSYAVSVGIPGEWTGCISYKGYPTFFKENAVYKVYGAYPAQYQILQDDIRGVQKGSSRSLAIVGEYLIYKSAADVVAYDGSSPVSISSQLGRETRYYNAVGGSCMGKYYLLMKTVTGKPFYFVYDMEHGIWEKEDALDIIGFTSSESGQLYAATESKIYGLGSTDNIIFLNKLVGEDYVSWWAETGDIGLETPDHKYVGRVSIRAQIPYNSEISVQVSYDDRPYSEVCLLRGNSDLGSQSMYFIPLRCDHFKVKLAGHGNVVVYSMSMSVSYGSEE